MKTAGGVMPERVQLSRKKGWRMPPNTVSVARPGKWGNPFVVLSEGVSLASKGKYVAVPTIEESIARYRHWLMHDPHGRQVGEAARKELRGKNLACWCKRDQPCHAEVLLQFVNRED